MIDMARKVVGVGSVGTRAFIALLQGRDDRTRCSAGQGARPAATVGRRNSCTRERVRPQPFICM
jgi:hypothetical protein